MIIANGEVYTEDFRFENKNLRIRNGIYEDITDEVLIPDDGEEIYDATGLRVIPGLTDIHFHGCMGSDLCDGTEKALSVIARYERSVGVMNICPATMTLPVQRLNDICRTAAAFRDKQDASDEAKLIGINLEGPFISPARAGAQDPAHVIKPDAGMLSSLMDASDGLARLVTIAPEEEGALECIRSLEDRIHFSVGHTAASYDEASAGFDAGADHVTHLYNAMPPFTHRAPGVIGAASEREGVMAELICDGIHVHASAVKAAFRLLGADRIVLISDSMRACGMPDGESELGGIPVIKKGREARQKDGTLAGSVTNLYDCMTEAVRMGVPPEDAIRAATYNPVRSIGLHESLGLIKKGRTAQALLIDPDWRLLKIIE